MSKYLSPKNDLTFKAVFAEHKHLCISLINSILPLENPVVSIEYLSGELLPMLPGVLKNSIVDVRCTDSAGRNFIVEMQLYWSNVFQYRVLFNASKTLVMQVEKGAKYNLIQPVYVISFINDVFDNSEEYYHYYKIVNIKDTQKQIKGLEFLFIELPKFKPENRAQKKLFELWLSFLTEINENTSEVPEELLANELTREAIGYMERSAFSKEELDVYLENKMNCITERGVLEESEKKGKIEGEKETNVKNAKGMKQIGISVSQISQITGLTPTEIEAL